MICYMLNVKSLLKMCRGGYTEIDVLNFTLLVLVGFVFSHVTKLSICYCLYCRIGA